MRQVFVALFMLIALIGNAQMLPINRTKIMRPIDPPRKTTCKFSDGIGKTIVVTKYIEGLDYNVYSKRLVNAASRGDVKAQFALWYLYHHGQGVAVDDDTATKYLKMAADNGLAPALHQLGICYLDGVGISIDNEQAVKCFEQSASKGNMDAQTYLAWCYLNGVGVTKNRPKAMQLYKIAADKGNAIAQCAMGIAYEKGEDLPHNEEASIKYLQLASNQGDGQAQYELACVHHDDYENNSVPIRNRTKEYDYFKSSAENGFLPALEFLGECYSLGIGTEKMTTKHSIVLSKQPIMVTHRVCLSVPCS